MKSKADSFFDNAKRWREEFAALRVIALENGLTEEFKWMHPCYTLEGSNVVLIHGFKEYCALLFMKGALLKDSEGVLIQQTENVQAARQIRFACVQEILEMRPLLKSYIDEAIKVEKTGVEVSFKKTSEFKMPDEFKEMIVESPALKRAFESLTPGRQRAYLLYFSAPKQSKTRTSRVQKCVEKILDGKGLDD